MNIEKIDKWLDEEYGCSYTKLEELHDYYFEKYTDQKEEITRLNNIIDELVEDIQFCLKSINQEYEMSIDERTRNEMESCKQILENRLKEFKEGK